MSEVSRTRKPNQACSLCGLSGAHCICHTFKKIRLKTRVDLLVHYKELKRTSNTGRLIEDLLSNQKIWIRGEKEKPLDHSKVLDARYNPVLLFPCDEAQTASSELFEVLAKEKPLQILVPDGNWRQASKVHYRVKEFQHISRITLPKGLADRSSLLRKESKEEGMSTLEAIAHLLSFAEGEKAKDHLLKAYHLKKKTQLKLRGL